VACKDPELPLDVCSISERAPCHPYIRFENGLPPNQAIGSIQIRYFLHGEGIIRLNLAGGKCIDYSTGDDTNSICEFVGLPNNINKRWLVLLYKADSYSWVNWNKKIIFYRIL